MIRTVISFLNPIAMVAGYLWIVLVMVLILALVAKTIEDLVTGEREMKTKKATRSTATCHREIGAKKVTSSELPSFFDDVEEFQNGATN